jgi:catechol 2,3-dioxygenase-like lactoylglutathione lyase family enzyme
VPDSTSKGLDRRTLIGGAAGAAAAAAFSSPAAAADGLDVSRLVRTALFVSDIEEATAFYRDLLGLDQVFYSGNFTGPVAGRLLGIPENAKTIARIFKAEGPPYGMIGLFQVTGAKLKRVRKKRGAVNIGEGVLVFYMPKLDPLVERLTKAGWTIVSPPVNLVPAFREMMFYGPDDVLINVIERNHRATS